MKVVICKCDVCSEVVYEQIWNPSFDMSGGDLCIVHADIEKAKRTFS